MTDAYVFQAALYCAPCGEAIAKRIDKDSGRGPWCEDSNYYPAGPYPDGGGEADSPQHCDACREFLRNALTDDGRAYVRERMADGPADGIARTVWAEFYGIGEPDAGQGAARATLAT